MNGKPYLLPGSILLGSVIVACGLYLGLRERATVPAAQPEPSAPSSPAAPPPTPMNASPEPSVDRHRVEGVAKEANRSRKRGPSSAPGPASIGAASLPVHVEAPSPPVVSQRVVEVWAKAVLEIQKQTVFLPRCWTPALMRDPNPATSRYDIDMSFNAEGVEVMRGVVETRGESRADVGVCLRTMPIGLRLPPPGANFRVIIPIEFP